MHGSYFTFGYDVTDLLFKGLSVSSVGGLIGLCLGVAAFTFIYDAIKLFRRRLVEILHHEGNRSEGNGVESPACRSENSALVRSMGSFSAGSNSRIKFHIIQTTLYIIQTAMAYMIMLIVMSYNVWLGLSVLFTSALTYLIFGVSTVATPLVVPVSQPCIEED